MKTQSWVPLPGAKHGEKDLFVQLDWMCGNVLSNGSCDPTEENLFPAPDADGNDPLAIVKSAFTSTGVVLHLQIGNAVPETTCTDTGSQLCQFPGEPGVIGWKDSLEFSKLWPRNFASCAAGGDCTPRFPFGQKDSYHYVLFGHSLAIPAWNTRYGNLTSISAHNSTGLTTITTTDRGTGINECPSRFTISGVLSSPSVNGVYNTSSCPDSKTIILLTPGVPNWSYNYSTNTPPEPAIGLTSGTVTSISGYSDLGGADSAVTLALWETSPTQNMSTRANVVAGTLFHEIGHTLGLSHGGLYYQTPGSYIPTFDVNCKPNFQSSMNYLFQLDGVGPNGSVAYSNQTLATLSESSLTSVTQFADINNNPSTYSTSAWYVPYNAETTTASAATMHCDGTPLNGDSLYYRVDGSVATSPGWMSGQNITYDGPSSSSLSYSQLLGYNDVANMDLRQVGATGGEFASLASILSFGSLATPMKVAAGGNVTLGSGGLVTLGSGGTITGASGTVTIPSTGGAYTLPASGGLITMGSGGLVTLGSGGLVTLGSGGIITLGSGGVSVGSGGTVALGLGGTITLGSGGIITMGSGGLVTLGSGGTITSGGSAQTVPAGTYNVSSGGIITMGSGGLVTLGSGGLVTLGSGGLVTLGSGGTIALGSGGAIALGSGGLVTLGSGGETTDELDYLTANSIVRPPPSATYTQSPTGPITVNWTAPAFGVVQTYTIYRSVNGGTPMVIGSVSGVNGNSPATTFTDTNPLVGNLVYTISTTLLPVAIDPTQRQSVPSPPAVLTNNQTIVLDALPSSVTLPGPQTVSATAMSNGTANGLQVNFGATGSCSIGSQSISSGVSSASVVLNSTGSCTITALQAGASDYNAASPVSGTFTILLQSSTTRSQTITFGPLPNVQYGNTFSAAASSNVGAPVSLTASGPCTASGSIAGVGVCTITASAPAYSTSAGNYSAASLTQSYAIFPATLTVTANNLASVYGQPLPALTPSIGVTYSLGGFVNNESASVVSGVPALSTTAIAGSNPGSYPITVSTGTLAAANYSFLYVSGTLTIGKATATINVAPYSVTYNGKPHTATGTATGVGGVSLPGLTLNTTHSAVGTYSDTWTFTDATGNYNNASGTVTDTILTAPLTITASSPAMIYGGTVPPIAPIYMGFVNNENALNLTTQPICTTSATSASPVGNYTSNCSNASDSNYSISYAPGTVQVNQASTTIAVTSSSPGNTSTFMQSVTFTATVLPQSSGATPTGTVTFYNNGSQIGTGALSLGQAMFSTSSLPDSAPNAITAIYSGDSNFTSSQTSSALVQTVSPAPNVSLSPLSVAFGNQNVNTTSSPMTVILTNNGDATLNIGANGISISPSIDTQFAETNTCGLSVLAAKSCTITITFKPADTGIQTASLQITDNDDDLAGAQQVISITGAGLSTITGASLYRDAVFATANGCGSITGSGGTSVDSFNSTLGYSSSHVLSGGNVGTNGNVSLSGGSIIYGSAAVDSLTTGNCSSSAVTGDTISGGAKVTGGLVALNGPVTYPVLPALYPAPPITNQKISGSCPSGMSGCTNGPGNQTVTLAPGTYGNVQLSGSAIADLSKGAYNFNSLVLTGGSKLSVAGSGPVVVNLAGASLSGSSPALDLTGGTMENSSGIPANLQFTYAGSQGVNLSGGAASYATVYAPNAVVNISGGADFFGSVIASKFTNSAGGVVHFDSSLPGIQAGNYIWFNATVNNLKNLGSGQVKLYLTNSTISFTANNTTYNVAVPNAVVTFNSASQSSGAKTTYDSNNNRWSTAVSPSALTGNTFITGLAIPVPANFPAGIQNVTWSAAFTTDAPGVTLNWQWGAAVYPSSFGSTYATASNSNVLGVNAEDGAADANGSDAAGTPETYKTSVIFGATGGGGTNYTGYFSPGAGVVPTIAPMSVSPSSVAFSSQAQGTTSAAMTAVLTNNDAISHTISSLTIGGTNAADFASANNCPIYPNTLAAGASCTISATFTPGDVGTRTAKVVVNDDASNNPQALYLSGTGH